MFTKAPWEAIKQNGFDKCWRIFSGMKDVAVIDKTCQIRESDNAHLIAAAPDLLEACKLALECETLLPEKEQHPILANRLQQAIAKAEGKL
jgi:hypothetical protein